MIPVHVALGIACVAALVMAVRQGFPGVPPDDDVNDR